MSLMTPGGAGSAMPPAMPLRSAADPVADNATSVDDGWRAHHVAIDVEDGPMGTEFSP